MLMLGPARSPVVGLPLRLHARRAPAAVVAVRRAGAVLEVTTVGDCRGASCSQLTVPCVPRLDTLPAAAAALGVGPPSAAVLHD